MELDEHQIKQLDQIKLGSTREKEIVQIVKDVNELNKLWIEFSALTFEQGELINNIESNVEKAELHIEEGTKIVAANTYQKKSRSRLFCLCGILFAVIFIVILIIILVLNGISSPDTTGTIPVTYQK